MQKATSRQRHDKTSGGIEPPLSNSLASRLTAMLLPVVWEACINCIYSKRQWSLWKKLSSKEQTLMLPESVNCKYLQFMIQDLSKCYLLYQIVEEVYLGVKDSAEESREVVVKIVIRISTKEKIKHEEIEEKKTQ